MSAKKPPSINDQIAKRVRASGAGSVFTPRDFLDLGQRSAVDQALSRLTKRSALRRLAPGLYDYPKTHPRLGALSPDADRVAGALARETGSRVQITGARAANALGLSTQVTAKDTYLTDGPGRRVILGQRVIDLKHAGPKHLIAPGSTAGTVVQALRYLGPSQAHVAAQTLSPRLTVGDKKVLQSKATQAPAWMRPALIQIAQSPSIGSRMDKPSMVRAHG
jgi:hypothetical protein